MIYETNVFVSYTRRDGNVSDEILQRLHDHLAKVCNPFIHTVASSRLSHQQFGVIRALMRSHLVVLIESPALYRSPWVLFELALSRLRLTPLIRLRIADLETFFTGEKNRCQGKISVGSSLLD